MNWGKWIIVSFVFFTLFIGTLVTVCMRQDMSLVSPDYYKQELAYQQQINRKQHGNALSIKPTIVASQGKLLVTYPDFGRVTSGELKLFRPSDERLDQTFQIQTGTESTQTFNINQPQRGTYKASLSWSVGEMEYFIEETLYLN
jgi:hypothetical protein